MLTEPAEQHFKDMEKSCDDNDRGWKSDAAMNDERNSPPGNEPAESKLTRSKQRWAREGRFLTGRTARPEQNVAARPAPDP